MPVSRLAELFAEVAQNVQNELVGVKDARIRSMLRADNALLPPEPDELNDLKDKTWDVRPF